MDQVIKIRGVFYLDTEIKTPNTTIRIPLTERALLVFQKIRIIPEKTIYITTQINTLKQIDIQYEQQKEEDYKAQRYEGLIMFCISGIIGLISIILGLFSRLGYIGAGVILGGSLSLLFGYSHYWNQLYIPIKLLSIVLALISVIGLSYYFAKK